MKNIHDMLKEDRSRKEMERFDDLAQSQNDSAWTFKILKEIEREKPKEQIYLKDNDGIILDENLTNEKITQFFQKFFNIKIYDELKKLIQWKWKHHSTWKRSNKPLRNKKITKVRAKIK